MIITQFVIKHWLTAFGHICPNEHLKYKYFQPDWVHSRHDLFEEYRPFRDVDQLVQHRTYSYTV